MGYFEGLNGNKGIAFMDGAEKGEISEIVGMPLHIEDYGYIMGDESEFAVICFAELPGRFYFGNSIITDALKQVDKDNMKSAIPAATVTFEKRTSKKGREYMAFTFTDAK